jgi:hypothetical protein
MTLLKIKASEIYKAYSKVAWTGHAFNITDFFITIMIMVTATNILIIISTILHLACSQEHNIL